MDYGQRHHCFRHEGICRDYDWKVWSDVGNEIPTTSARDEPHRYKVEEFPPFAVYCDGRRTFLRVWRTDAREPCGILEFPGQSWNVFRHHRETVDVFPNNFFFITTDTGTLMTFKTRLCARFYCRRQQTSNPPLRKRHFSPPRSCFPNRDPPSFHRVYRNIYIYPN